MIVDVEESSYNNDLPSLKAMFQIVEESLLHHVSHLKLKSNVRDTVLKK